MSPVVDKPKLEWEPSVNDISDGELLGRAVRMRFRGRSRGHPRWVLVMERFGLGSTYAKQLCRKFGSDPDEMVKP